MMRVIISAVGWYAAICDKNADHLIDSLVTDSASRAIQHAHRHNVRMHPRRARRDLRRLVR